MTAPASRSRREVTRFVRFLIVGTIGAVVDFGTFNLLANVLHLNAILSSTLSFAAAVTSNFVWNRYWTYPDSRSKPLSRQATQFTAVNFVGWLIRTPVYAAAEGQYLPLAPAAFRLLQGLPVLRLLPAVMGQPVVLARNMALATAVIVILFWNFFVNRFWTYSDVS